MIRNPILHDPIVRMHHILLCAVLGLAYGVCMGVSMGFSTTGTAVDAVACIPLFYGEALILWSIFMFSRIEALGYVQSLSIHIVYAVFAVVLMIACEWIVLVAAVPDDIHKFELSLPARIFTLFVMYTSFKRYYDKSHIAEEEILEEAEEESPDKPTHDIDVITRITAKVGNKIKVIAVEEIIFIKAEDDYVNVFTAEGHWLKSERLKDYETSLPASMFARVHRSYIVNLTKISKIERYGIKQLLSMNNGEQIPISATGYKVLKEKLNL